MKQVKQDLPVALVTGVGPGTGAAIARRFARGGYAVAMLARNRDRLNSLEREIEHSRGYACDVTDEAALDTTIANVRSDLGARAKLSTPPTNTTPRRSSDGIS
jgi:NAD(P)-dependent dehydrogenase (short-subunit alcohol dehydrogenase family)